MRQGEPQRRTDAGEFGGEPPLVFRTKAQMVYEQLRDWIVRGRLQPGESVDQERLAGMLDVSRMPLTGSPPGWHARCWSSAASGFPT